ncbi:unnamed protein product, partial [Urochloa humidicola]
RRLERARRRRAQPHSPPHSPPPLCLRRHLHLRPSRRGGEERCEVRWGTAPPSSSTGAAFAHFRCSSTHPPLPPGPPPPSSPRPAVRRRPGGRPSAVAPGGAAADRARGGARQPHPFHLPRVATEPVAAAASTAPPSPPAPPPSPPPATPPPSAPLTRPPSPLRPRRPPMLQIDSAPTSLLSFPSTGRHVDCWC